MTSHACAHVPGCAPARRSRPLPPNKTMFHCCLYLGHVDGRAAGRGVFIEFEQVALRQMRQQPQQRAQVLIRARHRVCAQRRRRRQRHLEAGKGKVCDKLASHGLPNTSAGAGLGMYTFGNTAAQQDKHVDVDAPGKHSTLQGLQEDTSWQHRACKAAKGRHLAQVVGGVELQQVQNPLAQRPRLGTLHPRHSRPSDTQPANSCLCAPPRRGLLLMQAG